jgi:hypothetical protein
MYPKRSGCLAMAGLHHFAKRKLFITNKSPRRLRPTSRYKIKEHVRHGEASSVNVEAVEKERERLAKLLAPFAPRDQWNADETGWNP